MGKREIHLHKLMATCMQLMTEERERDIEYF